MEIVIEDESDVTSLADSSSIQTSQSIRQRHRNVSQNSSDSNQLEEKVEEEWGTCQLHVLTLERSHIKRGK